MFQIAAFGFGAGIALILARVHAQVVSGSAETINASREGESRFGMYCDGYGQ